MDDQVFIQHRFSITEGDKTLNDALVLPYEEYKALSPQKLQDLKQERFDTWKHNLDHPVQVKEPPLEDKIDDITDQIADLTSLKTELELQLQEEK